MGDDSQSGTSVTGTGMASAPPDIALVEVGVAVVGPSVATASSTAAAAAHAMVEALSGVGVGEGSIRTTSHSVEPQMDHRGDHPVTIGYRVATSFTVRLTDTDRAAEVLEAATAAAGDHAVVNGLRFEVSDPSALRSEARRLAWEDALERATQLAALAGRRLGRLRSMTEGGDASPGPVREMAFAAKAAGPPVLVGQSTVTVRIQANFDLD